MQTTTLILIICTSALHLYLLTRREEINFRHALGKGAGSAVAFCMSICVIWPVAALMSYHMRVSEVLVLYTTCLRRAIFGLCILCQLVDSSPSLWAVFSLFCVFTHAYLSFLFFLLSFTRIWRRSLTSIPDFPSVKQLLLLNITTIEQVSLCFF